MNQEIWKDIRGYEGLYQVSNLGRIKSLKQRAGSPYMTPISQERILKPVICEKYAFVSLANRGTCQRKGIHRLVASAFIREPKNDEQVNHKDFNPLNNHMDNLEWMTLPENRMYTVHAHRHAFGVRHGRSKFTEHQINRIRLMKECSPQLSQRKLARMFKTSQSHIQRILTHESWAHL